MKNTDLIERQKSGYTALGMDFRIIDSPEPFLFDSEPFKTESVTLSFCTEGFIKVSFNLHEHVLRKNCFVITYPGQLVRFHDMSKDYRRVLLILSPSFHNKLYLTGTLLKGRLDKWAAYTLKKDLTKEVDSLASICKTIIENCSYENAIEALLHLMKGFTIGLKEISDVEDARYGFQTKLTNQFFDLVEQEYKNHKDLTFYADRLNKSHKYISQAIKASTGKTATEWIERAVIFDAKAQLLTTDKSIAEIAEDLGFSSQSFFGKYFKRIVGVAPHVYRKKVKEE